MGALAVNEIFGPTFQGEGSSLGRRAVFLRLTGCNLHCSWCDTPYTWDWHGRNGIAYNKQAETHLMPVEQVNDQLSKLAKQPNTLLVISGGEPMLQNKGVYDLMQLWSGDDIEIETNGTVVPQAGQYWYDPQFNVSPKLLHSGNGKLGFNYDALIWYKEMRSIFKFVVQSPLDFKEIEYIASEIGISKDRIWCMPEGRDPQTISEVTMRMADEVLAHGWNLTTRLHVQLWGDKRGR